MKITPAMQRCLEYVAERESFDLPLGRLVLTFGRLLPNCVKQDTWERCHKAGLLRVSPEGGGSRLTDAGRKALDDK